MTLIRNAALIALVGLCACGKVKTNNDGGGDDDDDVTGDAGDDDDDDDVVPDAGTEDAAPPDPDAGVTLVGVEVTPSNPSFALGLDVQLEATAMYSNGDEDDVTGSAVWDTDDDAIATVADGLVTGVDVGVVQISATFGGLSDAATVTVGDPDLLAIDLDPPSGSIPAGTSFGFDAYGTYTNGSSNITSLVTWESSDDGVAAPTGDGFFYGYSAGTVTVTASLDGESATGILEITTVPIGSVQSNPGDDCTHLRDAGVAASGVYWIDPDDDGDTSDAFQAYCDMTTDGGGWTLLAWTNDSQTAPLGVPYPGLAPCPGASCARGSAAGPDQIEPLVQRSTEFGKGSSNGGGASVIPLGSFEAAGKYVYGSLAGMDLLYGAQVCGSGAWTGVFHDIVGVPGNEGQTVYLSQFLAFGDYNTGSDGNTYIWNIAYPGSVCDSSGNAPGAWLGTWYSGNFGPNGLVFGRHAVFVRSGGAIGSSANNPGDSCLHILQNGGNVGDGVYWIDPANTGAFQAMCDMTTDGGGWTITLDVDAAHFDGKFINNHVTNGVAPTVQNQTADVWNAEAVMPVTETLWACGQQDNAASYYWRYSNNQPHDWMATTTDNYYVPTLASNASNAAQANCGGVSKTDTQGYGWVVLETGTGCGTCSNMLFGMYHYGPPTVWDGCNSTSTTYGAHASPWDGRSIQYPICNLQQTSNGRFWMGVR